MRPAADAANTDDRPSPTGRYLSISFGPPGRSGAAKCGSRRSLASYECQEVCIDHVGMSGHHAVRESGVNLKRAMFEQLRLQQ
jgi:hypothetical protein